MDINIREAKKSDDTFLAWVMLTAARSHRPYGIWDHYVGGTEQDVLSFLKQIATTQQPHLFHYSTFLIAEIEGQCAGALSGYNPETSGFQAFAEASPEIFDKIGWTKDQQKAAFKRYLIWLSCLSENTEGVWIVENVAVLPEYRGKGIMSKLLDDILEKGKKAGHKKAQIGHLINNTPAQRTYEKSGFEHVGEKRDPEFEKIFGTPGITKMLMDL